MNSKLPGTANILKTTTGFFCTKCDKEITPIWIETLEVELPSCEDCFLNELIKTNPEIGELIDPIGDLVGEGDEDTLWAESVL